ncbi:protein phosphatase 1 regulatory subunit 16A isoform X1 [Lutzomyia longipalpis]|uniref:Protein phosphatase 1 regulatory subunit 16A n=1 Tax=Lutzomyia longipalpis TaxID=7200 RepID=A0A7G3ATX1_LUTLO|nr:protein phosphatase 1 regulatory subunit 16A isoform X1 [Lutzomyia longipalpis]XP_055693230.1 protein phosphatase 1 regulatory subunit 16A isoform X1 [Lutzomyia longipalpis]XP_055693231.1 protein phosphatase 1 regulatory subunit 16A isoform X1 [Lutzomyia longipalpis]
MEHADLVAEMAQVEHLSTQDRLQLARMRRAQQLKVAKQKEKEWQKSQNRRDRNSNVSCRKKRHIEFENSVMLLEAAARNDIVEVAKLLQKGVTPDATNEDGLTALHQCCIDNNADMLRLLLDYGANVNAQDSEKWTPLHAAATCGHLNLVKFLINRGANLLAVNADGNMPYDLCDDEETLDCIEAEMSRRGVTQELIDETRAGTEIMMLNDLEEISIMGGDLEMPDHQGATPLHIAAANGYARVVEFLLDQHIVVDAVDNDLWTPVHAAACWGHLEVLEMLAQAGADLNAKNRNDETPSDICEDAEIRERIEQLRTEQESKRLAEAQKRRVKRSQSNNTRAQSVRRTSLRDKTLTTKKDAVEEARLRLQAQEGYTTTDGTTPEPISLASEASAPSLRTGNNNCNHTANNNGGSIQQNGSAPGSGGGNNNNNTRYPQSNLTFASATAFSSTQSSISTNPNHIDGSPTASHNRRSPEGKDNEMSSLGYMTEDSTKKMLVNNNALVSQRNSAASSTDLTATEFYTASNENGKINVQVTVLFDAHTVDHSIAGTLADLKKHRAQSRNSNSPENGSILTTQSLTGGTTCPGGGASPAVELSLVSSPSLQTTPAKFSGITGDVVSDSTRSRKCCVIM